MTNINTASRADLEIAILENNLETLFGGLDNIISTDTEVLRDMLINWIVSGNETI